MYVKQTRTNKHSTTSDKFHSTFQVCFYLFIFFFKWNVGTFKTPPVMQDSINTTTTIPHFILNSSETYLPLIYSSTQRQTAQQGHADYLLKPVFPTRAELEV